MFHLTAAHPTTRQRPRRRIGVALCTSLLGLVPLNTFTGPARAAEGDPLLVGVSCPDQNTAFADAYVAGPGWVPGWTGIERQRRAYVCLINAVRAKVKAPKLSACSQDGTSCERRLVAAYTREQMANLTAAAQWKAMDADYLCTSTGDSPHHACGRRTDYWLDWWRTHNPGVSYTHWAENLTVGWPYRSTPRAVIDYWLSEPVDSTGHRPDRENLLDSRFHYLGVGVTPAWTPTGPAIATEYPYYWPPFRQVVSADFIN